MFFLKKIINIFFSLFIVRITSDYFFDDRRKKNINQRNTRKGTNPK